MKNKLCLVGMLTVLAAAPVLAETSYVTINLTDGSKRSYLLADSPKFSYSEDMFLVSGVARTAFPIEEVESYHFTEGDYSDAATLGRDEVRIVYTDNNNVKAEGLQPNTPVALYSTEGSLIQKINANENGVAELALPQAEGVYVLKTNSQSVKLIKK